MNHRGEPHHPAENEPTEHADVLDPRHAAVADHRRLMASELGYWRRELTFEGVNNDHVRRRLDPRTRHEEHPIWIDPYLERAAERFRGGAVKVLDLGSGPLTNLAWVHQDRRCDVTAIDPLGDDYRALLVELKHEYPVVPEAVAGEDCARRFGPEAFHVVYSRNALDHVDDVQATFAAVARVLCPGGLFLIEGPTHEGRRWGYQDLHRYSLSIRGQRLLCENRAGVVDIDVARLGLVQTMGWPDNTRPFDADGAVEWLHACFEKRMDQNVTIRGRSPDAV